VPETPLTAQLRTSTTMNFTTNTFHFLGARKTQRERLGNEKYGPYLQGCVVSIVVNKNWGDGLDFQTGCNFLTTRQSTKRSWLPNRARQKMVLGDNLGLEEVVNLALTAPVSRYSYHSHYTTPLHTWVNANWVPLLGYTLDVFFLPRGCLGFRFHSSEDVENILGRIWSFDTSSLMLKRWRISFNPAQEYFQFRHFWILLPGLPLNL